MIFHVIDIRLPYVQILDLHIQYLNMEIVYFED